jgi:hypothetical protein
MQGYYNIIKTIKDQLQLDDFVNTVTDGSIDEVDLDKQTIYPLSHLMVTNGTYNGNIWTFSLSVICMDLVDISKDNTDNEDDVLNTQLAVINRLLELLNRGSLYTEKYQLNGSPSVEPFTDRFENKVAGWTCSFDINIQNDMTIC